MSPSIVLTGLTKLNFVGVTGILLNETIIRVLSFTPSYVILYFVVSRVHIIIIISIIMAQGSMVLMLLAFKRQLVNRSGLFSDIGKVNIIVLMYRETQLACNAYNQLHQLLVIPTLIFTLMMATKVSLFTLMSKFVKKKLETLLLFGNGLAICLSGMTLAFEYVVKVYRESDRLIMQPCSWMHDEITCHLPTRRLGIIIKRYSRSFPTLKIFLFESNFFEGNTSLVMLDFSINCAINLILCGK